MGDNLLHYGRCCSLLCDTKIDFQYTDINVKGDGIIQLRKKLPQTNSKRHSELITSDWIELREPQNLVSSVLAVMPLMILSTLFSFIILNLFSPFSLEEFGINSSQDIEITISFLDLVYFLGLSIIIVLFHAAIALLAACVPVLGNILHISDIGPFALFDPTPFTFTITGIILFWGIMQHEFLNIIPVARENVIESMSDGYIVVDPTCSIVDINKAALKLIENEKKDVIGKDLNEFFGDEVEISRSKAYEGIYSKEISLKKGLETKFFNLSISPIMAKDHSEGKVLLIHACRNESHD